MENKTIKLEALGDEVLDQVAGGYAGQTVASGSFNSSTGTSLNIAVFWSAVDNGNGTRSLNVTVAAASSTLYCQSIPGSLHLTVNGMTQSTTNNPISYSGSAMTGHVLGSFVVPYVSSPASMQVDWNFGGTISGVYLGTIRAGGVAYF